MDDDNLLESAFGSGFREKAEKSHSLVGSAAERTKKVGSSPGYINSEIAITRLQVAARSSRVNARPFVKTSAGPLSLINVLT